MSAKRLMDVALTLLLLPGAAILAIAVGAAILLLDGRPVLYSQDRIGHCCRRFILYKFRSMSNVVDAQGQLLPDAFRLTKFGRFLRRSSLDELPQLWNVLRGEMSLVGPRPLLPEYLPRYSAFQIRRHEVPPGVTGWVQVNGRNALTWKQKFDLDVWYVDHRNLWLDLKILWMTALKVVRRDGISQDGHATMPEFHGEQQ
jgi:sugar transferase EpsL